MREWPLSMMRSSISRTVDSWVVATMSMRGTMISRTGCSPSSITLAILLFGRRQAAAHAEQPAYARVERVQRHQNDEEEPHQELDRSHEGQRDLLRSGYRHDAADELDQQQHQQLQ